MGSDILFKTITVDEKNGLASNKIPFVLEYHILSRNSLYGIKIVKRYKMAGVTAYEDKKEFFDVCSDFEEALSLIDKLASGLVTPMSLYDVLCDLA